MNNQLPSAVVEAIDKLKRDLASDRAMLPSELKQTHSDMKYGAQIYHDYLYTLSDNPGELANILLVNCLRIEGVGEVLVKNLLERGFGKDHLTSQTSQVVKGRTLFEAVPVNESNPSNSGYYSCTVEYIDAFLPFYWNDDQAYWANTEHYEEKTSAEISGWLRPVVLQQSTREELVEQFAKMLYANKTDEADDGSWIEANDYYKIAEESASICEQHILSPREDNEADAIAFAEWLSDNIGEFGNDKDGYWWRTSEQPSDEDSTTAELYKLYKQQTK